MNEHKGLITAAMLTYNRIETAIASIESVIRDPHVDTLWVFDDGSSSENWAILAKFCKSQQKIRLVGNKTNRGHDYNFMQSAVRLTKCSTEFAMLCESDMLFAKGWGEAVVSAFELSPETVCLAPMLHKDQLRPNRSETFRKRCIEGIYEKQNDGRLVEVKKPFGSCYSERPDAQKPIPMGNFTLRYVSNSVCTMVFRKDFFCKLPLSDMKAYEGSVSYRGQGQQDAWMCWACYAYNNYNPKSLAVLDPGLALTFGQPGLHGDMRLNNIRWIGSLWWRYKYTSFLSRLFFKGKYQVGRFAANWKKKIKEYGPQKQRFD